MTAMTVSLPDFAGGFAADFAEAPSMTDAVRSADGTTCGQPSGISGRFHDELVVCWSIGRLISVGVEAARFDVCWPCSLRS
ncbi:hypothetical protein SAMN06264855_11543 [Halorubrum vacuolatum]|uniref:Uncharacterized protein n=1 Tax=Halorubrum vacuolatum TaxID=63740 RepID=A0A238XA94_HALVU|nr:hypothetical protein SAMN06264855_11543 [Halorubrum vacuolatum]